MCASMIKVIVTSMMTSSQDPDYNMDIYIHQLTQKLSLYLWCKSIFSPSVVSL